MKGLEVHMVGIKGGREETCGGELQGENESEQEWGGKSQEIPTKFLLMISN
jgi:hypothetical protein